jgi:glycosyltransferase involved in cell wall biosynthesis
MNILILSQSYAPVLGGLQTVTAQLAKHLVTVEHQVMVVTNKYPRGLPAHETIDKIDIQRLSFLHPDAHDFSMHRPDLYFRSRWQAPITQKKLQQIVDTFKPDVISFHYPQSLIPFVLNLNFQGRLVVSLHGHDVRGYPQLSSRQQANWQCVLGQAHPVTACSGALRDEAAGFAPASREKCTVIHNGVDITRFNDRTAYKHTKPYMLSVGRLIPAKGFDMLIAAFAAMAGKYSDYDLLIAGEGSQRNELTQQISKYGLGERVHLIGRASPKQVVQLINGCMFIVVPSRDEPFGIVALEGMAGGKRVLASAVGGLPEVLPVPPNILTKPDVESLRDNLAKWCGEYAKSPEQFMQQGEGNRQYAARFDLSQTLAAYERILTGG